MSVFVKTSDPIVFHFKQGGTLHKETFYLDRIQNDGKERICKIELKHGGSLPNVRFYDDHGNRTSVLPIVVELPTILLDVTISKAEKADNGTYTFYGQRSRETQCFTVFILGRYTFKPVLSDLSHKTRHILAFQPVIAYCCQ